MLRSIKKILLSKWEFKKPALSDVLIYDAAPAFSSNLQKILKKGTYQFFYTRGEVLNLPIFFKTLALTGINKLRFNYKKNIVQSINPKFVITQNYNDQGLYYFKKYGSNFKIIVVQSSVYFLNFFEKMMKEKKIPENSIDYFFTFGDLISKKLKKYLKKTKFFAYGSFKNNAYSGKRIKSKKKILFLSAWKIDDLCRYEFPEYEKAALELLESYCKMRNLKLVISTRFSDKKYIAEINKFLNYKGYKFEMRKNDLSVYKSICSYDFIVFCRQTAGYEALSRGKKVLCLSLDHNKYNYRHYYTGHHTETFMHDVNKKKEGEFWSNKDSKKEIFKKIDFILNLDKQKWLRLLKREFKNYTIYDKNNNVLIKKLNEIGVPVKL